MAGTCLDGSAPGGDGTVCNDLNAVTNLTAVQQSGNQNVNLAWGFNAPPLISPTFDVRRDNSDLGNTAARSYTDLNVLAGSHTYQVRARAHTGIGTGAINHFGPWSGVMITVIPPCALPPSVTLSVTPASIWPPNHKAVAVLR